MDKKAVIFFSFFTLIMIGGSLVLSLWILPKYVILYSPYDIRVGKGGMIKSQSTEVISSIDYGPRNETKVIQKIRITQIIIVFGAIYIVLLLGSLLKKRYALDKPVSIPAYLFKISRLTGKSEYDIFCKAAEDWPVSGGQIEQDFHRYMAHQHIPYYVNDFVRKNKKHIDGLHISLF